MRDVDRSAGQYFLQKKADIFRNNIEARKASGIKNSMDLMHMPTTSGYVLSSDIIAALCGNAVENRNSNFDAIRAEKQPHLIKCEDDLRNDPGTYENFASGILADMPWRVKKYKIEHENRCKNCGDPINLSWLLYPHILCRKCKHGGTFEEELMLDSIHNGFEKLR